MKIEDIARVCHTANKCYCFTLGEISQPRWDDAPEWQRSSAIKGVEFVIANPDAGPSVSHESWYKQKAAEGWIYGAMKDPDKKQHPCMVPYDQLPASQQTKDKLFIAIVKALTA